MHRAKLVAAIGIALVVFATTSGANAEYRKPRGVYALFPQGLIKRIAMPGPTDGYMFKTFRQPILVAGKERSHLAVITNGVDDKTWSFAAILTTLLRNYCGIHDGAFAAQLIKKAYAAEPVVEDSAKTDASAKEKPLRRQSAVASACKVTVQIDGARWRKVTATFELNK
ncbi:MAG: hypothetical protein OEQ29_05550 [Alphaproteobacteria bacterium]|nr:hypothetical protein [Alphaproteobacteria bacterium]